MKDNGGGIGTLLPLLPPRPQRARTPHANHTHLPSCPREPRGEGVGGGGRGGSSEARRHPPLPALNMPGSLPLFAASNSIVENHFKKVEDFDKDPARLGQHLKQLAADPALLAKHRSWKKQGVSREFAKILFHSGEFLACRACEALAVRTRHTVHPEPAFFLPTHLRGFEGGRGCVLLYLQREGGLRTRQGRRAERNNNK